jgi:hypothetical protein
MELALGNSALFAVLIRSVHFLRENCMQRESGLQDISSLGNREIARLRMALLQCVVGEEGRASRNLRRAAFENTVLTEPLRRLIEKVVRQPTQISGGDFTALRASGFTEDQLFELVVCAAVGAADRQLESAIEALKSVASAA